MKHILLAFLFIAFGNSVFSQVRKVIVKEFPNGKPEVIYYVKGKGENPEKVKEEVYYENGKLEYSGEYANDVEHGEWKYYYKDGTLKAVEHWKNGVEDGTWYEYHPDGKLAKEMIYKNGKLVKTNFK